MALTDRQQTWAWVLLEGGDEEKEEWRVILGGSALFSVRCSIPILFWDFSPKPEPLYHQYYKFGFKAHCESLRVSVLVLSHYNTSINIWELLKRCGAVCYMRWKQFIRIRIWPNLQVLKDENDERQGLCAGAAGRWSPLQRRAAPIIGLKLRSMNLNPSTHTHTHIKVLHSHTKRFHTHTKVFRSHIRGLHTHAKGLHIHVRMLQDQHPDQQPHPY